MSIALHPNDEAPKRFRVFNSSLKINKTFSIKKLGFDAAKKAAEEVEADINKKLKTRQLIESLDMHKLFKFEDVGAKEEIVKIRGCYRRKLKYNGKENVDVIDIQVRINNAPKHIIVVITDTRPFEEAYKLAQAKLLAAYNMERTHELSMLFKRAKRNYW